MKAHSIASLILAITLSFFSSLASAQEMFKLYSETGTGSRLRSTEVVSPVPFDKAYADLNDAQKEHVKLNYPGMPEGDVPPYPLTGTASIYRPIIDVRSSLKKSATTGTLMVVAMIDESGSVEDLKIYKSPSKSMSKIASTIIFDTKFTPASCNGSPCKMEFLFEYEGK